MPTIKPRSLTWALATALAAVTIYLYWPATSNQFVSYDDTLYVQSNLDVQKGLTWENVKWAFCNTVSANWHPVTMLSHMLDCQLYGLNPWGHHLTSLLLHALDTVLLFLLLNRMTKAMWLSAWVAALFAVHPLHVESVAWVAERKDVLSAAFGFLALWFYVQYAQRAEAEKPATEAGKGHRPNVHRSRFYWLAWFSFALGLMSKPMLVTWPFVLLLMDYWPLGRFAGCQIDVSGRKPSTFNQLLLEKIPFFVLSAASSVVTLIVQKQEGAVQSLAKITLGMRCENALISYWRYLVKLFWPVDLAVFYPYPGYWPLGLVLAAVVGLAGLSVLFWMKRQHFPFLIVGWLWFLGTLLPVIGMVQVGAQSIADRYTYIPSVGVLLVVVWGAYELSRRWRYQILTMTLVGSAIIIACFCVARHQTSVWKNSETLFRHSLKIAGDSDIMLNNLGLALLDNAQTNSALGEFEAAIKLNPALVEPHVNLGNVFLQEDQTNAAMKEYQEAIRLNPNYALARYGFGRLLAKMGNSAEAISQFKTGLHFKTNDARDCYELGSLLAKSDLTSAAIGQFQEAIRLKTDYAEAYNDLGNLLATQGQTNEAIAQFQRAISLEPRSTDARYNLGIILSKTGKTDEAISQFQEFIRLKPDDAEVHYLLGNLLAKQSQTDGAISQFQEAIRFKPDFAEAYNNLGTLLAAKNQTADAISQFQAAIRLKPDYTDAHYNLGDAFLKIGQLDEAVVQFQTVIRLSPDSATAHYYLGIAYVKQGQNDEAISQFQTAITLRPDYAFAHDKLGILFGEKGRLDEAIAQFQEAIRLKPDYDEAKMNLALALKLKSGSASH